MGLSGSFGLQRYVCKVCGYSLQEYTPHCPACLNKQIAKGKVENPPGPTQTSPDIPSLSSMKQQQQRPALFGPVGALLLFIFTAFVVLFAPKSTTTHPKSTEPLPTEATAPARIAPPPVTHVRPRAVTSVQRAAAHHAASASSGAAPRRGQPMQIWTSGDGD
jgi:hypothetical protein